MTTKIGLSGSEASVPDPLLGDYAVDDAIIAGAERTLDGTLRTQYVAAKKRWPNVVWRGVTSTQRDTLLGELRRLAHLSWKPPETGTFTVRVVSSSWRKLSATRYEVTAELEEV